MHATAFLVHGDQYLWSDSANLVTQLRQLLLSYSDDFLMTVIDRLLTYALGRGLEATDMPAVRQIKREATRENYRFASLIQGIVASTPFQMRMAQEQAN